MSSVCKGPLIFSSGFSLEAYSCLRHSRPQKPKNLQQDAWFRIEILKNSSSIEYREEALIIPEKIIEGVGTPFLNVSKLRKCAFSKFQVRGLEGFPRLFSQIFSCHIMWQSFMSLSFSMYRIEKARSLSRYLASTVM